MVGAHQAMYGGGQGGQQQGNHSSETVGAGAAMQALKMFTVCPFPFFLLAFT